MASTNTVQIKSSSTKLELAGLIQESNKKNGAQLK
tara:strand:- start:47717 stop:47821 length:105 start_codon:yes stop_codon:yes gene_type:complete